MLMTLNDLQTTPQGVQNQCVQAAMSLSDLWESYVKQSPGDWDLHTEFRGERGRGGGIHASELSRCRRLIVYSAMNTERKVQAQDKNPKQQRVFDIGTIVHAYVQSQFHEMCDWVNGDRKQLTFEDEAAIHPGLGGVAQQYNMHSSCDGIFTFWQPLGQNVYQPWMRVGLEIKTINDDGFGKLSKPKDDHMEQTCLYQKALDVPLMWVLYFNKNNQMVTRSEPPFLFKFNAALWGQIEKRIQEVYAMAQQAQLPARQEGFHCSFCPFAHVCKPNYLNAGRGYSPPSAKEF